MRKNSKVSSFVRGAIIGVIVGALLYLTAVLSPAIAEILYALLGSR